MLSQVRLPRQNYRKGVNAHVQFGDNLKAQIVLLSRQQHIPFERICEFVRDLRSFRISPSAFVNTVKEFEESPVLEDFDQVAFSTLLEADSVNNDESGISVDGKNCWEHALSCWLVVLFFAHHKRGREAMEDIGFLAKYT
jgi:transposase